MVKHGLRKNMSKDEVVNINRRRRITFNGSFYRRDIRCEQCNRRTTTNKGSAGCPVMPLSFTKCNWLCDTCYTSMVEKIERRRLRLMKEEIDRRLALNQAEEEELCVIFDSAEVLGAMKDLLDQIERLEKLEISRCCI